MTNFSGLKNLPYTFVVFIMLVSIIILPIQSFSQENDTSIEPEPELFNNTTIELEESTGVNATIPPTGVNATIPPTGVNATIPPTGVNATIPPTGVNVTGAIQEDEEEIPLMLIIAAAVAAAAIGGAIAYSKSRKSTQKAVTKKFCGKCGAAIDAGYKFCRKCGKPLPKK